MVVADAAWDFRRGFGSFGSVPAGTVVARLAENTGTLQRLSRVTFVEINSPRAGQYQFCYRDRNGSNIVVAFPVFHPGTLASQGGRSFVSTDIDNPLAEVPAGKQPFIRNITGVGTAPGRLAPNQYAFGLFMKSGMVGSVGP